MFLILPLLLLVLVTAIYLLYPGRTNVLLLGLDYTEGGSQVARSDTNVLATIVPSEPYVGMLSIPRDLWLTIPGVGENRINTAHYFAEAYAAGSGPFASMETIRQNFGVDVDYYLRVEFIELEHVVNAMGGVDVVLPAPMLGFPEGPTHLSGKKALAFARHREGSDDFFRMEHGQILMKAMLRQMLKPQNWLRIPQVTRAVLETLDTNIPVWLWPRLGVAVLRVGPDGIDNRVITREMVTPTTTSEGASILLPNWNMINPVLMDIFQQ